MTKLDSRSAVGRVVAAGSVFSLGAALLGAMLFAGRADADQVTLVKPAEVGHRAPAPSSARGSAVSTAKPTPVKRPVTARRLIPTMSFGGY